jgi:prevent-host-death family protein
MRRAFLDFNLTMRNGSHYVAGVARSYSVDEAKAKLGEILLRVKQGRSVTISERGREIARLVPIGKQDALGCRLDYVESSGQLTRATGNPTDIRPIARRPGALRRFLRSR